MTQQEIDGVQWNADCTAHIAATINKRYRPLGYNLILKYPKTIERIGNILMPDSENRKERFYVGTVVAIGPHAFKDEDIFKGGAPFKIGDIVMVAGAPRKQFSIKMKDAEHPSIINTIKCGVYDDTQPVLFGNEEDLTGEVVYD